MRSIQHLPTQVTENYPKLSANYPKQVTMNTVTHKVIIRDDAIRKDGTCLIALRVFINGKKVMLSLGRYILPKHWDTENRKAIKAKDARETNLIIDHACSKVSGIAARYYLQDKQLTKEQFVKEYTRSELRLDFIDWINNKIEKEWSTQREPGTIKHYRTTLKLLERLKGRFAFGDINYQFLMDMEQHMSSVNYKVNNKWKYHKNFRMFINEAIKCDIYIDNPYLKFKIKKAKTDPVFLDEKELNKLKKLFDRTILQPFLQEELRRFLFSCYTGLRFSDTVAVTDENIIGNTLVFLPFKTRKTYKMQTLELTNNAKNYLLEKQGKLFDTKTETNSNRQLKEIAKAADIAKNLTTHVGRHTFATTFLLKGGRVEALRELLGHTKIETTMVYVHVTDQSRKKQIMLMDD